jgi:hypothetical protein
VGLAVGTNVVGRDDGVKLGLDVDGVKLGLDVDGRSVVGLAVDGFGVGLDDVVVVLGLDVGRRLVGVLDVGLAVVWSIRRKLSFPLSSALRLLPRIEGDDRAVPTPTNESVITSWMTAYR